MSITQTISEFTPPLPSRNTQSPSEFSDSVDSFLSEINQRVTEENTWATQVNSVATDVDNDAASALASKIAAENASNATEYDTGKTGGYSVGDVVYSASTGISYRCIQAQAEGAVQPLTNTAYWTKLGGKQDGDAYDMEDALLTRPKLIDYSEVINALGDVAGGTDDIDLELGNVVTATISTAEQTFTFSNPPTPGTNGSFTLILTNGGSQTVNWPTSVDWPDATAPVLTAGGIDVLVFVTIDAGTIWLGFVAGLDIK